MITREKHIGKSTYRIQKREGRFFIEETYTVLPRSLASRAAFPFADTAVSTCSYRTLDEALQTLSAFDREKIIIGDRKL